MTPMEIDQLWSYVVHISDDVSGDRLGGAGVILHAKWVATCHHLIESLAAPVGGKLVHPPS
jgi:hypothetical protein